MTMRLCTRKEERKPSGAILTLMMMRLCTRKEEKHHELLKKTDDWKKSFTPLNLTGFFLHGGYRIFQWRLRNFKKCHQ